MLSEVINKEMFFLKELMNTHTQKFSELIDKLGKVEYVNDLKQPFYFVRTFCESKVQTEPSGDNLSLLHSIWRFSWKDSKLEVNVCFLSYLTEKCFKKESAALVHLRHKVV